ncbi:MULTISPECIES: hypothetical protein [unclassified Streptomyces]|uniref:hypothetical protein n=1 Tax=unclassified Streptomyces TaxID=2593676 RepID=UPI002DD9FF54|nr:hypothetical protein [Streptomyces sp. NBC_01763]WSC42523.1 hypothetical protein OHA08_06995 [Streptomyces sp. NBC_01763]
MAPTDPRPFAAVDLGASSGRVMVGRVGAGMLDLTIVTIARSDRQFTSITAGFTGRPGCQQSLRYPDFGCPTGMSLDRPAVGPRACGRAPPHRRAAWAGASPLRIRAGR